MSKFNFDPEYFRRVISLSDEAEKISPLRTLIREAIEAFYDEYDYYPDIGVFAPGVFTIMGDHLEYLEGILVQAALPLVTVIVGKSLNTVKCKVVTTAADVQGLKRMVFPVDYFRRSSLKVFPPWLTYIKGVITHFPCKDINGFDVLIHSNIPVHAGCGRSASLQAAFYTFLEAACGTKELKNKEKMGELCRKAEISSQEHCCKIGPWCNITSFVAEGSKGVILNCEKHEVSTFHMKEINILFLLTYVNFDLEVNDRDLIPCRKMELCVAATLLGLKHIKYATEKHLEILENMEDPPRETVESILRCCKIKEECIAEFIYDLFYFPNDESVLGEGEDAYKSECDFYTARTKKNEYDPGEEEFAGELSHDTDESQKNQDEKELCPTCIEPKGFIPPLLPKTQPHPMDYIHRAVAELCEGKKGSQTTPVGKKCEEVNCLMGLENISADSNKTVVGKLLRRVRHVVTEKLRCKDISDLIKKGDYVELGTKLIHSHLSLKMDYEVSCPTLDNLVNLAIGTEGVYGSKMISGGGTLTLLHRSAVEEFIKQIKEKFGPDFKFYLVFPSPGAGIIKLAEKRNQISVLSTPYPNKTEIMKRAVKYFEVTFKHKATHGAFAPSVLNFIGEHLDYNHGFVVSMATSIITVVVGALNCTSKIRVATTFNVGEEPTSISFSISDIHELGLGNVNWAKLIRGIVVQFKGTLKGFDCLIDGNLSPKLKLSNNASVGVSFYTFLEELFNAKTNDLRKKAYRCMTAEHEFLSLSGSSNHTIAIRAKENFFTLLDCKSMKISYFPFHDLSACIVLTFTGNSTLINKALLYTRGEECYKVAKTLGAKTLRCIRIKQLDAIEPGKVSEKAIKRARHVIFENERALKCAEALKNDDFFETGELMIASHNSLRDNYEVISEELNNLVKLALEVDGVMGCKAPGNEDIACIFTLVKRWAVDDLIEYLHDNYSEELESFILTTHEPCGPLNVKEYMETVTKAHMIFEDVYAAQSY